MEVIYINDFNQKILSLLWQLEILKEFSSEQLIKLFGKGTIRLIKACPGDYIIRQGEVDNWLCCLISGIIEIQKNNKPIAEIETFSHWFGEMSKVGDSPRSADVVAKTNVMCLQIDCSIFDRQPEQESAQYWGHFVNQFVKSLCESLDTTTKALTKQLEINENLRMRLSQYAKGCLLGDLTKELEDLRKENQKLKIDLDSLKKNEGNLWGYNGK